ncbi:uncharacterized protein LOC124162413 [Ischnura elegans]|uniref:uncharacterized protein LOC124162413 n=1 Tax=Ischnura elegans TaxID=197161 RepID=UPI001ED89707|nr:uncharacterized protein LOC124162413 [Ischnura elegans]
MAGTSFKRAKSTLVLILLAAEAISAAPLEFHLYISGERGQENIHLHFYKENATKATENRSGISGTSSIFNGDKFSPDFQSLQFPELNPQINPLGSDNSPFPNGNGFSNPGNGIFSNPQGLTQGQYPVGRPPQVTQPGIIPGPPGVGGVHGGQGPTVQSGFFIDGRTG